MATKSKTHGNAKSNTKQISKDDIEIMQRDQDAYLLLVEAITQNKRLAWAIVSRWLNENGRAIVHDEEARHV